METTTSTETRANNQAAAWKAAADASAQAETERKQSSRAPRSFTEKMPCKLSKEDIVAIADEVEQADAEASALEDERKAVNDTFKAKIALAEQRRADLIGKFRSKTEMRDVELVEEFVFATNTVTVRRADTTEIIRQRAMTRAERQEELPLEPKAEKKPEAKETTEPTESTSPAPESTSTEASTSEPTNDTEITAPQDVLDGAAPDEEHAGKGKAKSRVIRRGRKDQ